MAELKKTEGFHGDSLVFQGGIRALPGSAHEERSGLFQNGCAQAGVFREHTVVHIQRPHLKEKRRTGKVFADDLTAGGHYLIKRKTGEIRRKFSVEFSYLIRSQLGLVPDQLVDTDMKVGGKPGKKGDIGVSGPGFP